MINPDFHEWQKIARMGKIKSFFYLIYKKIRKRLGLDKRNPGLDKRNPHVRY
jgi:hypothetical protein